MRQIVYAPGCWDLLHVGHVRFLERAAALGDALVVGVPADAVVRIDKGRDPVIPLAQRLEVVSALRCVTLALPYHQLAFLPHIQALRPAVLAVGDWGTAPRHVEAQEYVESYGGRLVRI